MKLANSRNKKESQICDSFFNLERKSKKRLHKLTKGGKM